MRTRREKRAGQYTSEVYLALAKTLAANVVRLRLAHGWTQDDAAHECGMAVQVYQRIENERTNVTLTTLARLCEGFEVPARELFKESVARGGGERRGAKVRA